MDWRKACEISQLDKASRYDGAKKIVRYKKGNGYIEIFDNFREAMPEELEGYLDWEPVE